MKIIEETKQIILMFYSDVRKSGAARLAWGVRDVFTSELIMEGIFCVWDYNKEVMEWIKALWLQKGTVGLVEDDKKSAVNLLDEY